MRFATLAILLGGILAGPAAAQSASDELVYVKKETREETHKASLAASGYARWTSQWQLVGPFDNTDNKGFEAVYPPERGVDLKARYPGKEGEVRWKKVSLNNEVVFDIRKHLKFDDAVCYLYHTLESDRAVSVNASLGSDDGVVVWANGVKVFSHDVSRGAAPNQDRFVLPLKQGQNEILVKVTNRNSDWAVYFNVIAPTRLLAQLEQRLDQDFPLTGEAAHYRINTLPIPEGQMIEGGALAFRPDGSLLVGTRRGEIWLVRNPTSDDIDKITFELFARGLHEVLGLCVVGQDVYVGQRPEVTLLRDTDGDDRADEFVTVCDEFGLSGDYHEFLYGPVRDSAGNLYITLNTGLAGGHKSRVPYRGWCLRISPDGTMTPWASGLRSPNGVNFDSEGRLYYCDNQGEWIPACKLQEVRQGEFYGHVDSLKWRTDLKDGERPEYIQPAVWFPFFVCRSASEPVWDATGGRFGPFEGQCFVGDMTNSLLMRCALEEVGGRMQGACFVFRKGFQCGVNRAAFAPDGSLLVGETNRGWGSVGGRDQGLQRLSYTGKTPFEIKALHVTPEGWDVEFTVPIKADGALEPARYTVDSFKYNYWDTYGSPEADRRKQPVEVLGLSDDRRTVRLKVADRETKRVYFFRLSGLNSDDGEQLLHREGWYTLNAIPGE